MNASVITHILLLISIWLLINTQQKNESNFMGPLTLKLSRVKWIHSVVGAWNWYCDDWYVTDSMKGSNEPEPKISLSIWFIFLPSNLLPIYLFAKISHFLIFQIYHKISTHAFKREFVPPKHPALIAVPTFMLFPS